MGTNRNLPIGHLGLGLTAVPRRSEEAYVVMSHSSHRRLRMFSPYVFAGCAPQDGVCMTSWRSMSLIANEGCVSRWEPAGVFHTISFSEEILLVRAFRCDATGSPKISNRMPHISPIIFPDFCRLVQTVRAGRKCGGDPPCIFRTYMGRKLSVR